MRSPLLYLHRFLIKRRMIQYRDSNAHLSTEEVLARVSEEEIFRRYCRNFRKVNVKFCSELRNDPRPSAMVFQGSVRMRYIDYGYRQHSFDCFGLVMHMYSCTFKEALRIIDSDLNLGLHTGRPSVVMVQSPVRLHRVQSTQILIRVRPWGYYDRLYWSMYLIERELLEAAGVLPISHYWINGVRYHAAKINYAFTEHSPKFKLYSPCVDMFKWQGNVSKRVQGMRILPKGGERVVLTSSLKDVLTLRVVGVYALALQSESEMPDPKMIAWLKVHFKRVEVMYDNDFTKDPNPGQQMARRICELYGLSNIVIPPEYLCKDPSDVMEMNGPIILRKITDGKEYKEEREAACHQQEDLSGRDPVQVKVGGSSLPRTQEDECPF